MKVIGLDLSLTSTGWASWDGDAGNDDAAILEAGSFGEAGKRDDTLSMRQRRLIRGVDAVIEVSRYAALAVVEAHSFSGKGGSQHDRSGFWWLVVNELMSFGIPVLEVSPSSLKMYVTGNGAASKETMLLAQDRRFPQVGIKNDDEADALGLVSLGIRMLDPLWAIDDLELTGKRAAAFEKIRQIPIYE